MNNAIDTRARADDSVTRRTVTGIHNAKRGKVSNKWTSYLSYYDQLFEPVKEGRLKLFEVGIQNGGSLETWCEYFRNATAIIGCDIDQRCRALKYDDPRVEVIVGNANEDSVYRQVTERGPYDIVIDDGSHLSEDILVGFVNYFPALVPGGLYVIEDTHAVYQRESTNIHQPNNVFGFFKALTDAINYQFWHRDADIGSLLAPYFTVAVPEFLSSGWIESIEFRNSIITVRKCRVPGHGHLGAINIAGDAAEVDGEPLRIKLAMKHMSRLAAAEMSE